MPVASPPFTSSSAVPFFLSFLISQTVLVILSSCRFRLLVAERDRHDLSLGLARSRLARFPPRPHDGGSARGTHARPDQDGVAEPLAEAIRNRFQSITQPPSPFLFDLPLTDTLLDERVGQNPALKRSATALKAKPSHSLSCC